MSVTDKRLAASKLLTRQRAWQLRNPEKRRAHEAVRLALRRGQLVKQPCAECGDPRTDGHHPDYSKPLQVVWLCRCHHARRHARKIAPRVKGAGVSESFPEADPPTGVAPQRQR